MSINEINLTLKGKQNGCCGFTHSCWSVNQSHDRGRSLRRPQLFLRLRLLSADWVSETSRKKKAAVFGTFLPPGAGKWCLSTPGDVRRQRERTSTFSCSAFSRFSHFSRTIFLPCHVLTRCCLSPLMSNCFCKLSPWGRVAFSDFAWERTTFPVRCNFRPAPCKSFYFPSSSSSARRLLLEIRLLSVNCVNGSSVHFSFHLAATGTLCHGCSSD